MPNLDLGVIGNGVVAALIDSRGRIVWQCLPRFDGDPVFCSLLNGENPEAGFADVELENLADTQQAYLGNSAILVTTADRQQRGIAAHHRFLPALQAVRPHLSALDGGASYRTAVGASRHPRFASARYPTTAAIARNAR